MLPLDLYLKLKSNTGTEYKDQDPDPDPVRKVGSGSGQKLIGSATLLLMLHDKHYRKSKKAYKQQDFFPLNYEGLHI